jgi:hypothetical protein
VDADRFDALARTLAARLPRRALAGLVAGVLTTLGGAELEAKKHRNGQRRDDQQRRGKAARRRQDQARGAPGDPVHAEGQKKPKSRVDCRKACYACYVDGDTSGCEERCKGATCKAVTSSFVRSQKDAQQQQLATHLAGMGFTPDAKPVSSVTLQEGGVLTRTMLTRHFSRSGTGETALLYFLEADGKSISASVLKSDGTPTSGFYVDENGVIQSQQPEASSAERQEAGRERQDRIGAKSHTSGECLSCMGLCGGVGTLGCVVVLIFCGAASTTGVLAPPFLACLFSVGLSCRAGGAVGCAKLCESPCAAKDPCADGQPCAVIGTVTQKHTLEYSVEHDNGDVEYYDWVHDYTWTVDETGAMTVTGSLDMLDGWNYVARDQCAASEFWQHRTATVDLEGRGSFGVSAGTNKSRFTGANVATGLMSVTHRRFRSDDGCNNNAFDETETYETRPPEPAPFDMEVMSDHYTWSGASNEGTDESPQGWKVTQTWNLRWAALRQNTG